MDPLAAAFQSAEAVDEEVEESTSAAGSADAGTPTRKRYTRGMRSV